MWYLKYFFSSYGLLSLQMFDAAASFVYIISIFNPGGSKPAV